LNNLFTQIYGLEEGVLGILVFDEVMSFLDPKYIDFSYSLLERVNVSKRIIITHDDRLISRFNQKITVSLDPGRSSSQYSKNW
jgi:DNA repair exonuclease SbcCD ATPase subunit